MLKFIEFKDRYTGLRIVLGLHKNMSVHEQPDGSVVFNDNSEARSFHPDESYEEFKNRLLRV